jgi:hypothetical protein
MIIPICDEEAPSQDCDPLGSAIFIEAAIFDFLSGRRQPTSFTHSFVPFLFQAFDAVRDAYDMCFVTKSPLGLLVVATAQAKP